jgi:four helix bundle protein
MHNFRKLKVYERSVVYATRIYRITRDFPQEELYGLTSQLRRAASSIVLNIAEGAGNIGNREFMRFLNFSIRSGYECIACCDLARSVGALEPSVAEELTHEADQIIAMMVGLRRTLLKV